MDTGGDLADTSLHASLITQIGDVLASFTNDYPGILSANECAKREGVLASGRWGTRMVGGSCKADDKMSDHRWNDQRDDKHTGFTGDLTVLGVGGHGERRRGGGKEGGRRETGRGRTGCEEIRMADNDKTRHRGVNHPDTFSTRRFGSPPLIFSLSSSPVRVRLRPENKNEGEVFDLAHWHYP